MTADVSLEQAPLTRHAHPSDPWSFLGQFRHRQLEASSRGVEGPGAPQKTAGRGDGVSRSRDNTELYGGAPERSTKGRDPTVVDRSHLARPAPSQKCACAFSTKTQRAASRSGGPRFPR